MEKIEIIVPDKIRYLSEWEDFDFKNFPDKCIINKQIPGCGFTEWCITSVFNIVLSSPRRLLIFNKAEQHPEDVFLVRNDLDEDTAVDEDISKNKKENPFSCSIEGLVKDLSDEKEKEKERESKTADNFKRIHREIKGYIKHCQENGKPMKILVTYDSYRIVKDILSMEGLFWDFYTVVDEFQTILHDSRFKSSTELEFMTTLKEFARKVYFVSATPMLDRYLEMLDEFKDLPYFSLDWGKANPSRIIKPNLKVLSMSSVGTQAENVINSYRSAQFERAIRVDEETGEIKEFISKEAVLYVNSVNHIISIIKRNGLSPDEVNILCSNTDSNQKKIQKRLGKKYNIGTVPLRGEPRKMFTLCTRTVYLGADFYSDNARSFIFSDSNYDCLAVDISQDLPQILGRQRLECNPWKNQATFYYKLTCDYRKMTKDDFDQSLLRKIKKTKNLLSIYEKGDSTEKRDLAEKYKDATESGKYRKDYVAVNTHGGTCMKPVFNNLVHVSEIRAYDIQQIDYKDRFSVFSTINSEFKFSDEDINTSIEEFFLGYDECPNIYERLKYLCNYDFKDSKVLEEAIVSQLNEVIRSYYLALGPKRIRELCYNVTKIKKELNIILFDEVNLGNHIRSTFNIGDKLALSDLKAKLSELYEKIGYKKTPKAIDILDYFEVKEYMVTLEMDGTKKRVRGYELLNYK